MYQLRVRVIKVGSCTVDPSNMVSAVEVSLKHQLGVGGGSTASVVHEGDDVLLVDTGYENESDLTPANDEANWRRLETLLSLIGFSAGDVTKVFVSHFHRDHFGGIERFETATWYCHRVALAQFDSSLWERFIPLDDGDEIVPNTRVVHTPGHTEGHASLLWTDERELVRIGICGDAILNLAWLLSGHTWKFNADF